MAIEKDKDDCGGEEDVHLLFVTLYDNGTIPVSILMSSSVVQDGHGMLPLLSHSWRDFLKVKGIDLLSGLAVGVVLWMGNPESGSQGFRVTPRFAATASRLPDISSGSA